MESHEDFYKIGEMAQANGLSRRALLLYQDKGLIEPSLVDKETGYRYFSIMESSALDLISLLQNIGLSLNKIKDLKDARSVKDVRDEVEAARESIVQRRRELDDALALADDLLEKCDEFLEGFSYDSVFLIALPDRYALDIPTRGLDAAPHHPKNINEAWELVSRYANREIARQNIPRRFVRGLGYEVPFAPGEAKGKTAWADNCFALVDESYARCAKNIRRLPGGIHLVMYSHECNLDASASDDSVLIDQMEKLSRHARDNNLAVAGKLLCEEIFAVTHYLNPNVSSVYRYCLPVFSKED